ncbi:hypothetical protein BS78_07G067100 [Paspalum vaginatum]|nr:hypothetical protein BS78_07G067100 [Paspalum vaginatum]
MDHGGESPSTMRAESIELRMPATIVQGAEPGINTDMFDDPSAPYPQNVGQVRTSAEVLATVFRGELGLGVVHADDLLRDPVQENYHYYGLDGMGGVSPTFDGFAGAQRAEVLAVGMRQDGVGGVSPTFAGFAGAQRAVVLAVGMRQDGVGGVSPTFAGFTGAQRAEVLAVGTWPDGVGGVSPTFTGFVGAQRAEVLAVGLRPDGVGGVSGNYCTGFADAQRAELLVVGLRPDCVGVVPINYASFVGAQRGEVGLLPDGVGGAVYGDMTHLAPAATGRAAGIMSQLHSSNLGLAYNSSSADQAYDSLRTVVYDGSPGTLAERIVRRLLPVAGVLASSAAVTGLSAGGAVTPAAGLGSFALLLAGLAMIMIHVLRA